MPLGLPGTRQRVVVNTTTVAPPPVPTNRVTLFELHNPMRLKTTPPLFPSLAHASLHPFPHTNRVSCTALSRDTNKGAQPSLTSRSTRCWQDPHTPRKRSWCADPKPALHLGERVCGESLCICVPPLQAKERGARQLVSDAHKCACITGARVGPGSVVSSPVNLPVSLQQTPCPTAPPLLSG